MPDLESRISDMEEQLDVSDAMLMATVCVLVSIFDEATLLNPLVEHVRLKRDEATAAADRRVERAGTVVLGFLGAMRKP